MDEDKDSKHKYSTFALLFLLAIVIFSVSVSSLDGTGSPNYLAKFISGGRVINSNLIDDGTSVVNVSTICTSTNGLCGGGSSPSLSVFKLLDGSYYYRNTGFESVTAVYTMPWVPGAIASGTTALGVATSNHPGTATISANSVALNSGYQYSITGTSTYLLSSNYMTAFSFKPIVINNVQNLTNIRYGFMDIFTVGAITDGVYFNITQIINTNQLMVKGIARNNSVESQTTVPFNLTNNTWYTGIIYIYSPTLATFYIYNESEVLIWNDSVTTRIPTTNPRQTSHAFVGYRSGNATTQIISYLDYISVGINASIIR